MADKEAETLINDADPTRGVGAVWEKQIDQQEAQIREEALDAKEGKETDDDENKGKKVLGADPDPDEEGGEDADEDEDDEGNEDDDDDEGEDEDKDEDEDEDDDDESKSSGRKKPFVATSPEGDEVELHPDTVITVMVDGEEQEVTLHEATSSFSGQKVINKRLSEIGQEKKKMELEKTKVRGYQEAWDELDTKITKVFSDVKEGKGLEAYHPLIEFFGNYENPIDWEIDILNATIPIIQEMSDKTPEERQAVFDAKKLAYLQGSSERKKADEAPKERQRKYEEKISAVRNTHEIDDGEWAQACAFIETVAKDDTWDRYGIDEPTPETKIQFALDTVKASRAKGKALERLTEVAPKYQKKAGKEKFDKLHVSLAKIVRDHPDLTDEDLDGIVMDAVGLSKEGRSTDADKDNIRRKLGKGKSSKNKKTATPKKPKTFDELRAQAAQL